MTKKKVRKVKAWALTDVLLKKIKDGNTGYFDCSFFLYKPKAIKLYSEVIISIPLPTKHITKKR